MPEHAARRPVNPPRTHAVVRLRGCAPHISPVRLGPGSSLTATACGRIRGSFLVPYLSLPPLGWALGGARGAAEGRFPPDISDSLALALSQLARLFSGAVPDGPRVVRHGGRGRRVPAGAGPAG